MPTMDATNRARKAPPRATVEFLATASRRQRLSIAGCITRRRDARVETTANGDRGDGGDEGHPARGPRGRCVDDDDVFRAA